MDSFGFDFAGSEFLDIGSWGNAAALDASPSNGGLPFSVGTPTGVQSLGDEPFAAHDDFNFMDSPKAPTAASSASASASAALTSATSASSSSGASSSASASGAATKSEAPGDDLSGAYFGSDLGADDKHKVKNEVAKVSPGDSKLKADAAAAPSSSSSVAASGADASTSLAFTMGGPSAAPATSQSFPPKTGSSSAMASATSAATANTTAAANASSARPHIDGPSPGRLSSSMPPQGQPHPQMPQQQQQQRYPPNQMMMNPQPGQPGAFPGQPYGMTPQGVPMGGVPPGQPGMQPNAQYMQQPFRPATSTYDEEMMRVKSMMMQHPDLIPPPMEVLRISMAQASMNQNMMGGPNYMQRVGPQGPMMNRLGATPGYPAYGGPPNMMMPGQPGQPATMMDPRMRTMQQQQPQRPIPGQARTPGGSAAGPTAGTTPDSQTAWQSENDLPLRRKMIGKIVSLLQQRKPDAPAEWIRRLPDMARRLEDSLYRTAKNRDEYGDFTSLKTRLQHLAVTMGARAQHKAGANPRPQPGAVPGQPAMMGATNVPQPAMGMNPATMQPGMAPQPHVMGNMPYANVPGRMTQQQQQLMQQQQQQMQMQMQQNPQMRQQFTPQQMQQLQAAQMQRRQLQMQQQAQMQRQNSMNTMPHGAQQPGQPAQGQPGQPGQQPGQQQPGQPGQQQPGQQQPGQQQFPQQNLQRQNSMRQQPGQQQPGQPNAQQQQQMQQQMNQQRANQNFMQQQPGQQQPGQQQATNANAQNQQQQNAQLQRRNSMNGLRQNDLSGLGQGLGSDTDFLNLDLSQSFMGDDLSVDGALGGDLMKAGGDVQAAGVKRTLSQSQQQMAAAANAAAFKRSKVGGQAGPNAPRGSSPHSPSQSSQQNGMQKNVQSSGGASKTPPMSAVNAK